MLRRSVDDQITECALSAGNAPALREAVASLRLHPGDLPELAAALFDMELARLGDFDAKSSMATTAATLRAHWEKPETDALIQGHASLIELWTKACVLLRAFTEQTLAPALELCFSSRSNRPALEAAMAALVPPGYDRVEFALCLYHLELARLGADDSRREFAGRVGLLRKAYFDADLAKRLVGEDAGLAHLWKDLGPYLDEFFETQSTEKSSVALAAEAEPAEFTDDFEELASAPPPPDDDAELDEIDASEIQEVGVPPPLPPVSSDDEDPTREELAFWRYTEKALNLLPPPDAPRLDRRAFTTEAKGSKKRLYEYVDTVPEKYRALAPGRAFPSLLRLYLAVQVKEKSLFGQANPKRREAVVDALKSLSPDAQAAGAAAVWFELDGEETEALLQSGLGLLTHYLAFCSRQSLDPLDAKSPELFMP